MTALSSLSVDDLVDTATARLSEAEDALRELAKRDPSGFTRTGYQADLERREVNGMAGRMKMALATDQRVTRNEATRAARNASERK